MLFEIVIAMLLGILAGTFSGLIPGIHTNLIGVSILPVLLFAGLEVEPIYLVVFVVSMAITQTFVDFVPSIFLGAPEDGTELSVLPGHQLLKKGSGYEAVVLACYGSLAAVIFLGIISVPFIFLSQNFLDGLYNKITTIIPGLLIFCSFYLISEEKRKISAFLVFILTGMLGLSVLNLNFFEQPLLPLLTGLFGASTLAVSIKNKSKIPPQKILKPKKNLLKPLLGALIASPLCGFLPGLGGGQAAIIGNSILKTNTRGFLTLLGATNTLVMGISFIALYLISKTRTGAAAIIKNVIGDPDKNFFFLIILVSIIVGVLSFFLTIEIAKRISAKIEKINYTSLSVGVLIFLVILVTIISGWFGLVVLIISTITGIYSISMNIRRTNMMGCLIIPTIFLYLA
jgi:putative membrane protein